MNHKVILPDTGVESNTEAFAARYDQAFEQTAKAQTWHAKQCEIRHTAHQFKINQLVEEVNRAWRAVADVEADYEQAMERAAELDQGCSWLAEMARETEEWWEAKFWEMHDLKARASVAEDAYNALCEVHAEAAKRLTYLEGLCSTLQRFSRTQEATIKRLESCEKDSRYWQSVAEAWKSEAEHYKADACELSIAVIHNSLLTNELRSLVLMINDLNDDELGLGQSDRRYHWLKEVAAKLRQPESAVK